MTLDDDSFLLMFSLMMLLTVCCRQCCLELNAGARMVCCWYFHDVNEDSLLFSLMFLTLLSWTECRGQDVTLECHSEAFPKSINFWVNNKGAMLVSSKHHHHHHNNDKYKDCETIFLTLLPNLQIQNTKQWVLTAGTRSWTLPPKLPSVLSALSLS